MRLFVATALGLSVTLAAACVSSNSPENAQTDAEATGMAPDSEAPAPMPEQETFLQDEWQGLSLQQQKTRFLIDTHIEAARDMKLGLRLEEAELEIAQALALDPDNLEAKQLRNEIGVLLGRDPAEIRTGSQQLHDLWSLKKDQAKADAEENLAQAKVLQARGDYGQAVVELTLCLDIVNLSPYAGEWDGIKSEASALLDTVRAQRAESEAVAMDESQRAARAGLRKQEERDQARRDNVLVNLMDQTITAFNRARYEDAIDLADRVLRIDPRNEKARDIRDTAFRKGRELVRDDFLREKKEQYARWQEDLDELRIPYEGLITLPDEDTWANISKLRSARAGDDDAMASSEAETELRRLASSTDLPGLSVTDEESLREVINRIRVMTGLPLVVDPLAEEAAIDEGVVFNFALTNKISVERMLNLVVDSAGAEVTWTVRHGAILITTKAKALGDLVIVSHDIRDLMFKLTTFLAPRIQTLRGIDEIDSDEDGGGPFGGIGEPPTINDVAAVQDLIEKNISVGTWEDEGVSISGTDEGYLVVVHTTEAQQQIREFLEELRRFNATLVTIESKFMVIQDGFIQEIGVDWRGIDNPGNPYTDLDDISVGSGSSSLNLDNGGNGVTSSPPSAGAFYDDGGDGSYAGRTENIFGNALGDALSTIGGLTAQYNFLNDLQLSMILRLVEKSEHAEIINEQMLSVHNTQRAYVSVINQRAYVQDFTVQVATNAAIADPDINVLTEGVVLDVLPIVHHNRRYLTLEIQPTVAEVVSLTEFATTLSGQSAPVIIEIPEVSVQSVFTTVVIPDGGSVLLGGLSRLRNVERRAEVPWLANIPIIGFFFKEEGYSDERESLMIMIRAWITDVNEEVANLEAR